MECSPGGARSFASPLQPGHCAMQIQDNSSEIYTGGNIKFSDENLGQFAQTTSPHYLDLVNQNGDYQCSVKESSEGNNNIHGGVIAENQIAKNQVTENQANESATATVTTQAEDRDAAGGTRLDREQTATTTLSLDNATKVATQAHTGPTANGIGLADSVQVGEEPRTITLLPKLNLKLPTQDLELRSPPSTQALSTPNRGLTKSLPLHLRLPSPSPLLRQPRRRPLPLRSTVTGSPTIYYNAAIDVLYLCYIHEDACYEFRGRSSRLLPRRRTR
ncbi:hypothetical protein F5882DRAFT_374361 [Hyaloscypha sp. PMI_1271]|nr:hypothetical protein F5882DRAFT_374361 [Hyaloscypha sp. PMI_1271]